MRDIYTSAEQVVVWLGEESSAQVALKFCDKLENTKREDYLDALINDTEMDLYEWEAFDNLFYNRAWWRRTWILQEVMHQRPVLVYVGKFEVSLDSLCQK